MTAPFVLWSELNIEASLMLLFGDNDTDILLYDEVSSKRQMDVKNNDLGLDKSFNKHLKDVISNIQAYGVRFLIYSHEEKCMKSEKKENKILHI